MTNRRMENRVAIVTGAVMGMGEATALLFAEDGAAVVVADIDEDAGQGTVDQIRSAGGKATFVKADVSDEAAVEAMVAVAVEQFGRLDYAVNNAATRPDTAILSDLDLATFDRIVAINLRSVAVCLKHELRQMLAQGGAGAIVNIASISGIRPQPGNPAYIAAKAGVIGLTKSASMDFAPRGIRVNAVAPGLIETPMVTKSLQDFDIAHDALPETLSPFKRYGKPREVAEASHWLCSDRASLVTGVILPVDAGYTAI